MTLLRASLAHPDDDEARLVYADHLLEQGDPRGEFIVHGVGFRRDTPVGALLHARCPTWVDY